jgi:hypothetical protein
VIFAWQNGKRDEPEKKPEGEAVDDDSERDELIAMRYLFLYQSGVPEEHAAVIAQDLGIDWHEAVKLLKQGCDPALIVDILS